MGCLHIWCCFRVKSWYQSYGNEREKKGTVMYTMHKFLRIAIMLGVSVYIITDIRVACGAQVVANGEVEAPAQAGPKPAEFTSAAIAARREAGGKRREAWSETFKFTAGELPKSGIMVLPKGDLQLVAGQEKLVSYPTQGLVILLDDAEYQHAQVTKIPYFGALTEKLWTALLQQVPLLVSTSLLANIFNSPQGNPPANLLPADLLAASTKKQANDLVRKSFKPDEWIIRQVGDALILLLPNKMVKGTGSAVPSRLTERELILGLKIDHMKPLDAKTFFAFLTTYQVPSTSDYFIDALPTIFVTCPDYEHHHVAAQQPQWTFYLAGHGGLRKNIASLPFAAFRKMLDFFEDQPLRKGIITQLLIINSCYVMGTNVTLAYKNMDDQEEKTYSFPIAMDASLDTQTFVATYYIISRSASGSEVAAVSNLNFAKFFTIIASTDYRDKPYDIMSIVTPVSNEIGSKFDVLANNYPHVRPAFKNYIITLFPGIEIGSAMTAEVDIGGGVKASRKQPLDVVALLKQNKTTWDWIYLVLRAEVPKDGSLAKQYIKFPIILKRTGKMPIIVSSAPGAATTFHRIQKLNTEYDLHELATSISKLQYGNRKIFWIEELDAQGITYKDVIIDTNNGNGKLLYTADEERWKHPISNGTMEDTGMRSQSPYIDEYKNIFGKGVSGVDQQKLLIEALTTGNVAQAQQALAGGADPKGGFPKGGSEIIPFLHAIATFKEHKENGADIAALLINTVQKKEDAKAAKAYLEEVYDGNTPLHAAVDNSNVPLVRILLEAGADGSKMLDAARSKIQDDPEKYIPIVDLLGQWEEA